MQPRSRTGLICIFLVLIGGATMIANSFLNVRKNNEFLNYLQEKERIRKDREGKDIWSLDRQTRIELQFKYEQEEHMLLLDMYSKNEKWSFWQNMAMTFGGVSTMFAGGGLMAIWRKNGQPADGFSKQS